jgi:CRISPR system Cascade subunit CasA
VHFNYGEKKVCSVCGGEEIYFGEGYDTLNYGVHYTGTWVHPLSPYRFDKRKEKPPLSLKGQRGGLGYRHWLSFVIADSSNNDRAAQVTRVYMDERARDLGEQHSARLWCFGYDMDNMKARCWYDNTLPLFRLDSAQRKNIMSWVGELISAAKDVSGKLRSQVKSAWFDRPQDVKGDMEVVVLEFWQQSESAFYSILDQLTQLPGSQRQAPPSVYSKWRMRIWSLALNIFDKWVLEAPAEDLDMKRVITAREDLKKEINKSKSMKTLAAKARTEKEAA